MNIDFEKVYEKDTGKRSIACGVYQDFYIEWLETRLIESTEAMIRDYRNICYNCGMEGCPYNGNPIGHCGENLQTSIERNTGESIDKVLEDKK